MEHARRIIAEQLRLRRTLPEPLLRAAARYATRQHRRYRPVESALTADANDLLLVQTVANARIRMNQPVSPARCLGVAGVATGLLGALTAFLLPDLGAGVVALRAGRSASASFEELLVDGCAVAALLAATWLWTVTCAIALLAARGRPEAATTRVPVVVRRLVLAACGAALAGAVHGPAGATPGGSPRAEPHGTTGTTMAGLPLPDRALGDEVVTSPAARLSRGGRPGSPAETGAPVVVVRPGDTLWDLAAAYLPPGAGPARVTACWHRIHELNRDVIGDDPDLILPGQRLHLPPR